MMATVVRMPEVLAGATEAAIATWLVAPGQEVAVGTPLAEIETDKAVVEYAAELDGTVLQLFVDEGTSVSIGEPIVAIGAAGEQVDAPEADEPEPEAAPEKAAAPAPIDSADAPADADEAEERRFVSPLVRRLAREHGIDLADVAGSGPRGRIVRRDIDDLVAGAASGGQPAPAASAPVAPAAPATPEAATPAAPAASAPAPAAADPGAVEEVPLTPMRRAIARRLTESKTTVPHYYLAADCRVEALLALRKQINEHSAVRVSVNDLILKAVAGALRAVPDMNATWGDTVLRRHTSVDLAVAVAIDGGLVTPVVRDADRLTVTEVSRTVTDLAERARAGRLKQHELEGGAFSVSNLGMYGIKEFSAIINPPHSGILAVGAAREVPVVTDGELSVGTVMTVTLSADHRVADGALAAEWLRELVSRIENPLSIVA